MRILSVAKNDINSIFSTIPSDVNQFIVKQFSYLNPARIGFFSSPLAIKKNKGKSPANNCKEPVPKPDVLEDDERRFRTWCNIL
jgi:hypothetical protein